MVAGAVAPPRLDLANEDLVRSHVHAIWLAETGLKLGRGHPRDPRHRYAEDSGGRIPASLCTTHIAGRLARRRRAGPRGRRRPAACSAALLPEFGEHHLVGRAVDRGRRARPRREQFDRAFDRWRDLYRAALVDQAEQNKRVLDHTLSERDRADRGPAAAREAETQLNLLKNESADSKSVLSDFNPYRYLASRGLPARLLLPAAAAGRLHPHAGRRSGDGDYLQRPRFLAIREFGPGALIYHEGARYQVTRIQLPPDAARRRRHQRGPPLRAAAATTTTRAGRRRPLRDVRRAAGRAHRTACCTCTPSTPSAASGSPPTRRSAAGPASAGDRPTASSDHGARPGRQDAWSPTPTAPLADADLRRLGHRPRSPTSAGCAPRTDEPAGFWLDPADGRG